MFARLINSLSLRLPQLIRLRSGITVETFGRQYNNLFMNVFTSDEYLGLLAHLMRRPIHPIRLIDGGAACGYFSLLIHHLIKIGCFDWDLHETILIEPNPRNYNKLRKNMSLNRIRHTVCPGLLGMRLGEAELHFSSNHPWGSSVFREPKNAKSKTIPYLDIGKYLRQGPCLLKLDIEGSEFDFLREYEEDLPRVQAIVIEFHEEMGDVKAAQQILQRKGFHALASKRISPNRLVEIHLSASG